MEEGLISEWTKDRMIRASQMEAEELLNCYKDSLKVADNPLSGVFENEILRRMWFTGAAPVG